MMATTVFSRIYPGLAAAMFLLSIGVAQAQALPAEQPLQQGNVGQSRRRDGGDRHPACRRPRRSTAAPGPLSSRAGCAGPRDNLEAALRHGAAAP